MHAVDIQLVRCLDTCCWCLFVLCQGTQPFGNFQWAEHRIVMLVILPVKLHTSLTQPADGQWGSLLLLSCKYSSPAPHGPAMSIHKQASAGQVPYAMILAVNYAAPCGPVVLEHTLC